MNATDRRSHYRYRIELDLVFMLLKHGRIYKQGVGRTLNIGRGGLLAAVEDLGEGPTSIEMFIDWPVLLDGTLPVKLLVRGHVIRKNGRSIAVSMLHHEFVKVDASFAFTRRKCKSPRQ
jgi:hypothetical protein